MSPLAPDTIPSISAVLELGFRSSPSDCGGGLDFNSRARKLITAAQSGSATAFDELHKLYSARLFQIVFRITKNREDAEDAVQDAFLRAFVALRQFEGRSTVYSWLTRIAINSALMILRRRRARPEAILSCPLEPEEFCVQLEVKDPAPDPEEIWASLELSNGISLAIQKLKPRLRTPIELRLDRELSINELAETLNITVPAAKARLFRARAQLAAKVRMNSAKRHVPLGLAGKDPLLRRRNQKYPRQTYV
jgi:RNA polymerase sigma-70 factor, ECF subfamily